MFSNSSESGLIEFGALQTLHLQNLVYNTSQAVFPSGTITSLLLHNVSFTTDDSPKIDTSWFVREREGLVTLQLTHVNPFNFNLYDLYPSRGSLSHIVLGNLDVQYNLGSKLELPSSAPFEFSNLSKLQLFGNCEFSSLHLIGSTFKNAKVIKLYRLFNDGALEELLKTSVEVIIFVFQVGRDAGEILY
jgi:hypothetical protein